MRRVLIATFVCICTLSFAGAQEGSVDPSADLPNSGHIYRNFKPHVQGGSSQRPHVPMSTPPTAQALECEKMDLIALAESCLGEYQCMHPCLHPSYQVAFANINCHCYTGRCRPSIAKSVPVSDEFPLGIAILANKTWCPVTAHTLRRNNDKIPFILRQFEAHVCVGQKGCEELECAITNTGL